MLPRPIADGDCYNASVLSSSSLVSSVLRHKCVDACMVVVVVVVVVVVMIIVSRLPLIMMLLQCGSASGILTT